MKNFNLKEFAIDILVDIVGGMLVAIGVYNFAANSGFPVAGISGIALIFYHLFGLPIGTVTIALNIPIIIMCYRLLGKRFLIRSIKTMVISSLLMDYVAPLLPVYDGDRMLSAICVGVFAGLGYAIIYLRDTSTGGADVIIMSVRALKPHLSIGKNCICYRLDNCCDRWCTFRRCRQYNLWSCADVHFINSCG